MGFFFAFFFFGTQTCAGSIALALGTSCPPRSARMCRQPCAGPGRLGRAAGGTPVGSRQEAAAAQAAEALCQGRDVCRGCCPAGWLSRRCLPWPCDIRSDEVVDDLTTCGSPRARVWWGPWLEVQGNTGQHRAQNSKTWQEDGSSLLKSWPLHAALNAVVPGSGCWTAPPELDSADPEQ